MTFTNDTFNLYLEKYKMFVDGLADIKKYPENILHLLYVVVPAFVFKYGIKYERIILNMFREVNFVIDDREDLVHQAAFSRILKCVDGIYKTDKYVVLYNYKNADLMQLLDNLIHEFNHAVNSIQNEISWDEEFVYLRTGITYLSYDRKSLNASSKQEDVVLEEIINTRQTEMILEVIASFSKYHVKDSEIANILYVVSGSVGVYKSGAYYLETTICKRLLENKTFIYTLEQLRFRGEVMDFPEWFDTITGIKGSFNKVEKLLSNTLYLERSLSSVRYFKKRKVSKILEFSHELMGIINLFNQNCNFK